MKPCSAANLIALVYAAAQLQCFSVAHAATVTITSNVNASTAQVVPNAWSNIIFWDYRSFSQPLAAGTQEAFPFLHSVELFTATGGCYTGYPGCSDDRDLFVNPADPSLGYNFTPLLDSLDAIVQSGLLPYVVTGNVPIAFSATPVIGAFGVNTQPPSNFTEYGAYIGALAAAAVTRFGAAEVRGWTWGVLTEFNNPDWFVNDTQAYFDLYDWTVCSLQGVLGERIQVGGHACTQCVWDDGGRGWDPLALLIHARSGTNACTGGVGTRVTFLTDSFYETTPGKPGDFSAFIPQVGALRQRALDLGYTNLTFGIDEGRILMGTDMLPLITRAVGAAYQASFDAYLFKLMTYNGVSFYSRWGVTTNGGGGLWSWPSDVDPVSTHVARLSFRMQGDTVLEVTNTSADAAGHTACSEIPDGMCEDETTAVPAVVDATVSLSPDGSTLHVLAFRHSRVVTDSTSDVMQLTVCGMKSGIGQVAGTAALVDDTHSNFWPAWEADMSSHNITSYQAGWSPSGEAVVLTNATEAAYFASRTPYYRTLAQLSTTTATAAVQDGCLTYSDTLVGHAVLMLQFNLSAYI